MRSEMMRAVLLAGSRQIGVAAMVVALVACDGKKSSQGISPPTTSAANSTSGAGPTQAGSMASAPLHFTAPREARTSAYDVTWSLTTVAAAGSGNELKLDYAVKAFEELYVADRLWDDDIHQNRIPDPYGVYRFVQDGSLRLVFAPAPSPPNMIVEKTYEPLYSRVLAGETHRRTVRIKLPVEEYSALARNVTAPSVVENVSRVFFVLGYQLRSAMAKAPVLPMRETEEQAGYIVYDPQLIISELQVDPVPVRRRTGYMARFPLPGEPGPAPRPIEPSR